MMEFEENDKTFKFARHLSTETSVIFSYLMYKAFEVEFIISSMFNFKRFVH